MAVTVNDKSAPVFRQHFTLEEVNRVAFTLFVPTFGVGLVPELGTN